MAKPRREFSPEFKQEAVALLDSSGRPLVQGTTELGISPSMSRNWRALVRGGTEAPRATTSIVSPRPSPADQASEITRLKRELDRTRMERDVLKNRRGSRPACARHKQPVLPLLAWRAVADCLLEGQTPLKNVAHGLMRT